jgi:hypothetical protein
MDVVDCCVWVDLCFAFWGRGEGQWNAAARAPFHPLSLAFLWLVSPPPPPHVGFVTTSDVCMGGRVAEEILRGPEFITTGAGQDMAQATAQARRFCLEFSMNNKLGLAAYGEATPSEDTLAVVDREVEAMLEESYKRVKALLTSNKPKLSRLAMALLQYEVRGREWSWSGVVGAAGSGLWWVSSGAP